MIHTERDVYQKQGMCSGYQFHDIAYCIAGSVDRDLGTSLLWAPTVASIFREMRCRHRLPSGKIVSGVRTSFLFSGGERWPRGGATTVDVYSVGFIGNVSCTGGGRCI